MPLSPLAPHPTDPLGSRGSLNDPSTNKTNTNSVPDANTTTSVPKEPLPNPGTIELLHKEVREIFPTNSLIQGAKFETSKPLSQSFQIGHKFLLGPRNSFSIAPIYANESSLLLAELDNSGNLSGQLHYSPVKSILLKTQLQFHERGNSVVFDVEHSGQDYTSVFRAINPDIVTGTGIGIFQYLQSVTPKTAIGIEAMVQRGGMGLLESAVSVAGKHSTGDSVYTATLSFGGPCQFSYFRKVSEQISLGAELETFINSNQRESMATIGAKYDIKLASLKFMIDSKTRIGSLIEYHIFPGFNVLFSGQMDYWHNESKFGFGFSFGAPQ